MSIVHCVASTRRDSPLPSPAGGGVGRFLVTIAAATAAGFGGGLLARPPAAPADSSAAAVAAESGAPAARLFPTALPAAAGVPGSAALDAPANRRSADALVAVIRSGGDDRRLEALETALESAVELPDGLLVSVYEQPGSEALRKLAFETHIDAIASDVEAARAAMQSAAASDSPAVQAEAYARLDLLAAYEANVAEAEARLRQANPGMAGGASPPS